MKFADETQAGPTSRRMAIYQFLLPHLFLIFLLCIRVLYRLAQIRDLIYLMKP